MTASITDSLVTLATHVINDLGYFGVWLMTTTTGVIGLPGTEPTMLFAGFNVSEHHLSMMGIIIAGLVGDMTGASIAYAIGYYGQVGGAGAPGEQAPREQAAARARPPVV